MSQEVVMNEDRWESLLKHFKKERPTADLSKLAVVDAPGPILVDHPEKPILILRQESTDLDSWTNAREKVASLLATTGT